MDWSEEWKLNFPFQQLSAVCRASFCFTFRKTENEKNINVHARFRRSEKKNEILKRDGNSA